MKQNINSSDPDTLATLRALRRAARNARKLAIATRTPFYVMKEGQIVNLNPPKKRTTKCDRRVNVVLRNRVW